MSNKSLIAAALALGVSAVPTAPAQAAIINFTGPFAIGKWTATLTGSPAGGGAPAGVNTSGAPNSVTLTGGDSGCDNYFNGGTPGPCATNFMIAMPVTAGIGFHWTYTTNDNGADLDPFGVLTNGVFTELTNPNLGNQSGDFGMLLAAGTTFGFSINCTDCQFGEATVTISQFAVPEANSFALVALGLAGLAFRRRRRA